MTEEVRDCAREYLRVSRAYVSDLAATAVGRTNWTLYTQYRMAEIRLEGVLDGVQVSVAAGVSDARPDPDPLETAVMCAGRTPAAWSPRAGLRRWWREYQLSLHVEDIAGFCLKCNKMWPCPTAREAARWK